MRAIRLGLVVLALAVSTTACDDLVYECKELVVGHTYFVGRVHRFSGDATYHRMVSRSSLAPVEVPGPAHVRVGTQTVQLRGATPTSLSATGVPEITMSWAPNRLFGVNCRGDRTEAGLDLRFEGDRLAVAAVKIGPDPCDFAIGWDGAEAFSLPVTGDRLASLLPAKGTFRECTAAF